MSCEIKAYDNLPFSNGFTYETKPLWGLSWWQYRSVQVVCIITFPIWLFLALFIYLANRNDGSNKDYSDYLLAPFQY